MLSRTRIRIHTRIRISAHVGLALLTTLTAFSSPAASATRPADEPPPPPELYTRLRDSAPQDAGRLRNATLTVDRLEFTFADGQLYLLPEIDGPSTGAVFLGKGHVHVEPPDEVERQQLDRHLDTHTIDMDFERLVLRFADDAAARLQAQAEAGGRVRRDEARKIYRERHDKARNERLYDLDARILADLVDARSGTPDPRGGLFWADVDGKHWFSIELDPGRQEEIFVSRSRGRDRVRDIWTAFHLRDEYAGGPPGVAKIATESWQPPGETPEIAVDMAIDDDGQVQASARLRVVPNRPISSLRLLISPLLEVTAVRWLPVATGAAPPAAPDLASGPAREPRALGGEPVEFVQPEFGRGMNENRWDPRVTILLPRTFARGETFEIQLHYHGELLERLQSRDYFHRDTESWYPRLPGARRSRMLMTFRTRDRHRVATAGERVAELERDGARIESYRVDTPTTNMAFHYGDLKPTLYEHPELPITVYQSPNTTGFSPGNRDQTLADVRDAFAMYESYFGPAPVDSLRLSETPGLGGQSFPGFVLLSFATFGAMNTGEAELFRTHEIAHQWFGNEVSWDSYRDQWMTEGFAQYGAALYALQVQDDEDKFLKMMSAWRKDVLSKVDVGQRLGMRYFGFTPEVLHKSDGFESGPLWIGYRLAAFDTPNDYRILVYEKGAFVLHMLRMMLYDWEADDDTRFRRMMTSFYSEHRGGHPSTEDFLSSVEEAFGAPMDWFFDQWIYGYEVPTYREDLDDERTADGWRLRGRIRQQEVPDTFRMPVPIRVTYEDGRSEVFRVLVDSPEVPVDLALSGKPDNVEFNPLEAVLANVR